jgi:hypothetical protein
MKLDNLNQASANAPNFQGDVCFVAPELLGETAPDLSTLTEVARAAEGLIVTHSETGHHHYISDPTAKLFSTKDPNVCYLQAGVDTVIFHDRSYDTHAPIKFESGKTYKVIRQQEQANGVWRQARD